MKILPRFSFGIGDRFGHEGAAQLSAIQSVWTAGAPVHPVWNKSNREHTIIGTQPADVRSEADEAVRSLNWQHPYFVDADHITLQTVGRFLDACDFFTLDVAESVGRAPHPGLRDSFLSRHQSLVGSLALPGNDRPIEVRPMDLERSVEKFLSAMHEAGEIYRHIASAKKTKDFAVEVSVDETDSPQTPAELLCILAMIADEQIPVQTIAPKFTGRFNKGVDYSGNIEAFAQEFEADLCVVAYAVREFGLPDSLKISVHSGSDKFSLYPIIRRFVEKHSAGLHLKTAGTTWLEEVIGLAAAGGEALRLAAEIYARALPRAEELIAPYAPVVDIHIPSLPGVETVRQWKSDQFVRALEHDPACPDYLPQFRQFIHVSFKIAAELGAEFTDALKQHREIIASRVHDNLLIRHLRPLFC